MIVFHSENVETGQEAKVILNRSLFILVEKLAKLEVFKDDSNLHHTYQFEKKRII